MKKINKNRNQEKNKTTTKNDNKLFWGSQTLKINLQQ